LAEWAAFERLHGPLLVHERIDAAAATICATVASVFGKRSYSPSDFMPKWYQPEQSAEEQMSILRSLFRKEPPSQPSQPS